VIKNFRHKGLREFFASGSQKGIVPTHSKRLSLILDLLDSAGEIRDIDFPGSYLHPLKGTLKGYWAIRVSGNWRVIFQFREGDVFDIDYIDYH
jgi:toxin HigB-1